MSGGCGILAIELQRLVPRLQCVAQRMPPQEEGSNGVGEVAVGR